MHFTKPTTISIANAMFWHLLNFASSPCHRPMIFFEFSLPFFKSGFRYMPLCFFAAAWCRVFSFQCHHFFSNYVHIFYKLASLFSRSYCPDGLILTGHSHFWVAIWPVSDCYNCFCTICALVILWHEHIAKKWIYCIVELPHP